MTGDRSVELSGAAACVYPQAPIDSAQAFPLSFSQQRLWVLDRLLPMGAVYNVARALRLRGELDGKALQRALDELIHRHEAVRTRFEERDGEPVQVIDSQLGVPIEVEDLSALASEEREAEAERRALAEAQAPFDLERGPLIRARLLRLGPSEYWLLFTLHHIVTDGWSMGVLARELSALYGAYRRGEASPLAELPVQYVDYALWQRQWLQGPVLDEQLAYWRQALAELPVLELPTDRPRPPAASHCGARFAFELDEELTRAVKALGRREGATLFMTVFAAFQVLLYRYSGQEDFAVGVPVAGRSRPELEGLIGFFVNTLVLRADLSGAPSFKEYLARVRERALDAYAHQDIPFEKLVEHLAPSRDRARNPLFQVSFTKRFLSGLELQLAGLETAAVVVTRTETAMFDLAFDVVELSGKISFLVDYATDLFDAATIERLAGHYRVLLEAIVADPEQRISQLPLLTEAERHQLLVQWNDTAVEYPRDRCIHQLFEAQVERSPEATALVCEAQQLTYRELNARANRLAHHLRTLGVGPEVLVGVCLERSLELVVGLLGILKAGGAYVPLDPSYPAERLAFMLQDTQAPVLLTQQRLLARLPAYTGHTLCLEREAARIAQHPDTNPPPSASPTNLAYVIYTSGSTGKPKGVMIEQRSAVNYLSWIGNTFPLNATDRVLQKTPISFDASVEEIFYPLTLGAVLVIAGPDVNWSAEDLIAALQANRVTVLQVVPSLLASIVEHPGFRSCDSLRLLLCGAEILPPELARRTGEQSAGQLVNLYGPTETTVSSTFWKVRTEVLKDRVPIGRPVANTQVTVVDSTGQLVPIGVAGQLCIGGAGVARGYLNQPKLTAERYVSEPDSHGEARRRYLTGDRARVLPNGEIELLGRGDAQLKIRGFRIEPVEVETILREHPDVADAVVVGHQAAAGGAQLVAYVLQAGKRACCDPKVLRAYLKTRLPGHMVPSFLIRLESFPRLPNGKVDRKRLPELDRGGVTPDDEFTAPRNALEEQVAAVWAEVLGLEQVGVHQNFFESGGHSLLAMQLVFRIRTVFAVQIPLQALFAEPTVAALTRRIQGSLGHVEGDALGGVQKGDRRERPPLSYAQQRLWLLDRLLPSRSVYNVPLGVRLRGALDVEVLRRALDELVRRHEVLRTRFGVRDGEPVQVIDSQLGVPIELEDLSALASEEREAEAERRVLAEAQAPFDLERGPLVRARLLRLGPSEHWLLLNLHHIVTDGWSMGVLARELSALYGAYRRGEASPLAELPVQYADYALWQREWLQGQVLEEQLAYWRQALAELPVLDLPTDRPRPMLASYRGARQAFEIGDELTRGLKALGRREGATLFMTLLAAFQVLLYRYSGQTDIAVGVPVAGRSRPELEGLIGFFVNMLVLRADLSGAPSFKEHLARVRERALDAYAHQDIPFEKLVEHLAPKRDLSRNPLFQVSLVLQNTPSHDLRLEGLDVQRVEGISSESAKFDLSMELTERAGRLSGSIQYATDLFDAATIERLAGHYRVLLEAIVADPEQRISQLPLLTEAERHQLLVQWNDTAVEYPRDRCIHQLFEAQVERSPEATALVCEAQQLTYRELNARANRLAHHLRTLGVGPEVLVGVCLERSLELVVGLLAILKAGGAYVPLDPSYPAERLAFMLQDTQAPVLLTQQRLLARLPAYAGHTLCLEREAASIARQPATNPPPSASPTNLAYVIYTSGSTGKPKGVMIEQRAVIRLVRNADYLQLGPHDGVAQASNASFDAATFEVWGALLDGARLVVLQTATLMDAQSLADAITSQRITTLFLTTALFNRLAHASPPPFAALTHLLFGGERADPNSVLRVLQHGAPRRLIHVYGPTETTTFATWYAVTEANELRGHVPIGRSISNTTTYIVDRDGQPQPVGVVGELLIAGDGVARGYWHRPELTAERFASDPFSADSSARLYRTGDFARYRPDGNIEFIGRKDQQVKIRGFRIEPGEVEAVLASHPAVASCAVLVRETRPGESALVAYLAATEGATLSSETVRSFLSPKLPDYMLPAAFVVLPTLPLTTNGKVDRKKLPAPQEALEPDRARLQTPSSQLELHLVKLWERLLGVEGIGIRDSFFELGGHSLLAAQLFDEIERLFGRRLPLDTLWYGGATIADVARLLREDMQSVTWPILVPIKLSGTKPPLFVVHTMGGNLFHYDELARALDPQQPVMGLQARGVYGREVPRHRIEDIAGDCIDAIRRHQARGPYLIAGYSSAGIVAFEVARQLESAGEKVGLLTLIDSFSPRAKRKRSIAQAAAATLRRLRLRLVQERAYHAILHRSGLSHWRRLRGVGEAQRWAHWSYRARRYAGTACLFVANASLDLVHEPTLGWERLVRGGLRLHRLPGGHSSIMKAPLVKQLAAELQGELDRATDARSAALQAVVS